MPKFFQSEIAAFDGEKSKFKNVEFKKHGFENSSAAESGAILEFIPVHYLRELIKFLYSELLFEKI